MFRAVIYDYSPQGTKNLATPLLMTHILVWCMECKEWDLFGQNWNKRWGLLPFIKSEVGFSVMDTLTTHISKTFLDRYIQKVKGILLAQTHIYVNGETVEEPTQTKSLLVGVTTNLHIHENHTRIRLAKSFWKLRDFW